MRTDAKGRDLNRGYRKATLPQIRAHLKELKNLTFDIALSLHEDYDAYGLYLFEALQQRPHWGEALLESATPFLPLETRKLIDGHSRCHLGIVRRRIHHELLPDFPEAFILTFHHARHTLTIETPSEFSIEKRVQAQTAIIQRAVEKALQGDA